MFMMGTSSSLITITPLQIHIHQFNAYQFHQDMQILFIVGYWYKNLNILKNKLNFQAINRTIYLIGKS